MWALKKFRYIIHRYPIEVLTDHQAIKYLFSGKISTGRLARWFLTIQDFNPTFTYIEGKSNLAADALSRNFPHTLHVTTTPANLETVSQTEIIDAQCDDLFCSKLIYFLESGDDADLPDKITSLFSYILQNSMPYKSTILEGKMNLAVLFTRW